MTRSIVFYGHELQEHFLEEIGAKEEGVYDIGFAKFEIENPQFQCDFFFVPFEAGNHAAKMMLGAYTAIERASLETEHKGHLLNRILTTKVVMDCALHGDSAGAKQFVWNIASKLRAIVYEDGKFYDSNGDLLV
jgi:hypothetical protein